MRFAGMTREVDSLGRVVIPKELRKNFGIEEGTPLDIYTDGDNIVLHKHWIDIADDIDSIIDGIDDAIGNAEGKNDDVLKEKYQRAKMKVLEARDIITNLDGRVDRSE